MSEQQPILGHRDLNQVEIDLINECKGIEQSCIALVDRLKDTMATDKRWVAIGATDLQTGFMALVRSIARPEPL